MYSRKYLNPFFAKELSTILVRLALIAFLILTWLGTMTPSYGAIKATSEQEAQQQENVETQEKRRVLFGLGGIFNFTNPDVGMTGAGQATASVSDKYGFGGEAHALFLINEVVSLESGIGVVRKGYEYSANDLSATQKTTWIQLPVMGRLWLGKVLTVAGGPFIGTRIGSVESDIQYKNPSSRDNVTVNFAGQRVFDLGFVGALGLDFKLKGNTSLFLEGRYSRGVVDLAEAAEIEQKTNDVLIVGGVRL